MSKHSAYISLEHMVNLTSNGPTDQVITAKFDLEVSRADEG